MYDSTTSTPLANANVAVVGTNAFAESDENGEFRIDGVPEGEQTVVFFHRRLGTLGVSATPLQVPIADQAVAEVYLAIPSRPTILSAWCSAEEGEGDTSIGGIVTDALTGVPLPRARVTALGDPVGVFQRPRVVQEVLARYPGPEHRRLREAFREWILGGAESWMMAGETLDQVKSLKEAGMVYAGIEELKERAHLEGLGQGRREGRAEGHIEGRAEGRATLVCRQARIKFGVETADRLSRLLEDITDPERIARIGDRIIECETGAELLARIRES